VKARRHHNNDGRQQIARGKTRDQVREIARRLGLPFSTGRAASPTAEHRGTTDGVKPAGKAAKPGPMRGRR
jgi:hypothetical protein